MEAVLEAALSSVLSQHKDQNDILTDAIQSDLDVYDRHWEQITGAVDATATDSINALLFLSTHLVEAPAVDRVFHHLGIQDGQPITKQQFDQAAHLLYSSVRTAQDSVFDEAFAFDALPPSIDTQSQANKRNYQKHLSIGTVIAEHESLHGPMTTQEEEQTTPKTGSKNNKTPVNGSSKKPPTIHEEDAQDIFHTPLTANRGQLQQDATSPTSSTKQLQETANGTHDAATADMQHTAAEQSSIVPQTPPEAATLDASSSNGEIDSASAATSSAVSVEPLGVAAAPAGVATTTTALEKVEENGAVDGNDGAAAAWTVFDFLPIQSSPDVETNPSATPPHADPTTSDGAGTTTEIADAFTALNVNDTLPKVIPGVPVFGGIAAGDAFTPQSSTPSFTISDISADSDTAATPTSRLPKSTSSPALEGPMAAILLPLMSVTDQSRCQEAYRKQGYVGRGGVNKAEAARHFEKSFLPKELFDVMYTLADYDADGKLSVREFCIFMHLIRLKTGGHALPSTSKPMNPAYLLPEAASPHANATSSSPTTSAPNSEAGSFKLNVTTPAAATLTPQGSTASASSMELPIDRIRAALSGTLTVDSDDDDYDTNDDEYLDAASQPVSPVSPGHAVNNLAAAEGSPDKNFWARGAHGNLELQIVAADIKYSKPLDRPFASVYIVDSQNRPAQLPQDTPPGVYKREIASIFFNHAVALETPLRKLPPGSALVLEIKHWKSTSKKFSVLAWTRIVMDELVDFGPKLSKVRTGPFVIPLYKKPVVGDVSKATRLGGQQWRGVHLLVRGIEKVPE